MQKLDPKTDGSTVDIVEQNLDKLKELFPSVFTEGKVDIEALRETLGDYVDDRPERYSFTWNGKSRARRIAQTPSTGTLRPCPEESVNWDTTKNLFIEGDNLEVLKLLQKSYHKKVKLIYIDPPYNTGKEFIYPDRFQDNLETYLRYTGQTDDEGFKLSANAETSGRYHTNWLNMMYPRLKLARNLLADDGLIFVSIDDNECHNLRMLMNEVFGEENFMAQIAWKNVYGGGSKSKHVVAQHEYAVCFARNKGALGVIELPPDPEARKRYTDQDAKFSVRGPYYTQPLATNSMDNRPNLRFPVRWKGEEIWPERQWQWSKERVEKALANDDLVIKKTSNGVWSVRYKQYLRDDEGRERGAKLFSVLVGPWSQEGTAEITKFFGDGKVFPFPKPVKLIKHFISACWQDEDAIVLDFFAGSCPTAQAVLELNRDFQGNRHFIAVQLPEPTGEDSAAFQAAFRNIAQIGKERIRCVIKKIEAEQVEKAKEVKEKLPGTTEAALDLDLGFKVFKLDASNIHPWDADFDTLEETLFNSVENIKPDRSETDVLYELLLKYGLDLAVAIEGRQVADKTVFIIGAGALIVCLADDISLDVVEGIAALKKELQPEVMRVVFKDAGFKDDVVKTNTVQILQQAGIEDVKSL